MWISESKRAPHRAPSRIIYHTIPVITVSGNIFCDLIKSDLVSYQYGHLAFEKRSV